MASSEIAVSTTPPLPGTVLVQQINDAFEAVATQFSGSVDPSAYAKPYSLWADTGTGNVKRRNAANSAWDVVGRIVPAVVENASGQLVNPAYTGTLTGGTGVINIGSGQVYKNASGNVGIGTTSLPYKLVVAGSIGLSEDIFFTRSDAAGPFLGSTASVPFRLGTGGTEQVRIDASGNTGFGTASPAGRVDAVANAYSAFVARSASSGANTDVIGLKAVDSGATNFANVAYQARSHVWGFNGSTLGMVLDVSGKFGIGTSSPTSILDIAGDLTVRGGLIRANTAGASDSLQLLGGNALAGGSGSAIVVRGALAAANAGGMEFYTGNTVSTVERMRLTAGGNFGINITNPTRVLEVGGTFFTTSTIQTPFIGSATGTAVVIDGSGFLRASSSSRRYKENEKPIDVGLDLVMQMEPVSYDLKNGGVPQVGFIAEDFPEPRLVNKSMIDPEDPTKGEQVESINYANLTAILVKAIQEQQALITQLQADVAALKA